jgi:hypothetical protein
MGSAALTWPVFDVAELAEEAAEQAGIEFRSGYALRTARRSLELLSIEWANRGLNLWTIEGPLTINLQPDVWQYGLPEDTVDLVEHAVRAWTGGVGTGTYTDRPLGRVTMSEYAAIPNKTTPGQPSLIHIRRQIKPYVLLWMVPDDFSSQLVAWRLRRMKSVGSGGEGVPEIPWRFVPAMTAGLAYYLALKSKDQAVFARAQVLKAVYEEQFQLASDEDRDRATFRFVPGGYESL